MTSKRIKLAVELTADLPDTAGILRWTGEPVNAIIIPTSIFILNKAGYPVLSGVHQKVVQKFMALNVQVIITGYHRHSSVSFKTYLQYIQHLKSKMPSLTPIEEHSKGFEDYLQDPLQPLMDNLESGTYEVFEKDPIKYKLYQEAIYHAISDRVPAEEAETKLSVVMVVGAGRGPLVTASLIAAKRARRLIKVYAVEKNKNALVTLRNLAADDEMWRGQVTVISSDMRTWEATEKADILVSELLGSFGDNELSPECLDGAQRFLKEGGISIPGEFITNS